MNTSIMQEQEAELTLLARIRKSRTVKGMFMFVVLSIVAQIVVPTAALALTAGAASPEFASFEPVATTDMVNDFTGDFTYNLPVISVPGTEGGGYSMSLSYHSGVSAEEEASWVGLGWTLNPGAINRNKRGVVDDYKGADVVQYNKQTPNWTQTSGFDFNVEVNSNDKKKDENELAVRKKMAKESGDKLKLKDTKFAGVNGIGGNTNTTDAFSPGYVVDQATDDNPFKYQPNITLQHSIRFNNNSGFSSSKSMSSSYNGMASLSLNNSGGETTLGYTVNPIVIFLKHLNEKKKFTQRCIDRSQLTGRAKEIVANLNKIELEKIKQKMEVLQYVGAYSIRSYTNQSVSYSVAYQTGKAYNYSMSLQINPYGPLGFQVGIQGGINYQVPYPQVTSKAYGYQYNQNLQTLINGNENRDFSDSEFNHSGIIQSDFSIEKESTFEKHDRNLGIPFNSADIFSATGNGAIGGFQLHHNQIGHFYPNFVVNKQDIHQLGLEIGIGGTIEVGFDVGIGWQKTQVGDWKNIYFGDNTDENINAIDLAFLTENNTGYSMPQMRFSGDMGGELSYSETQNILRATITKHDLNLNSFKNASGVYANHLKTSKEGRSSHIEYSIYNSSGNLINPLDNGYSVNQIVNARGTTYQDLIGQIAVTNKSGSKSVYGIPVFTKNDMELSVGLEGDDDVYSVTKEHELFYDNPLQNYTAMGSKTTKPWASTFLLTQTTTSDYVDVDGNGPSVKDFGGWTKFGYSCAYGVKNQDNWYRYRAPYKGLYYNRGRLNDLKDGTGSMSSGDKEVYYLKTIETKTHIAFFVTNTTTPNTFEQEANDETKIENLDQASAFLSGSGEVRKDGLGASKNFTGGKEAAATGQKGNDRLQKLEKIVLFAKADMGRPVSTTYFEYDYKLCSNTENSTASGNAGKMTLKRVWTEGGGVTKTKIAPFQFEYSYYRYDANGRDSRLMSKYPDLDDVYANLTPLKENPTYQVGQLDAWGNYQPNSEQRNKNMQPWLDQTATNFDPAAWQLKRIILPSGGEIHVQYEQKDYTYVESEKANIMVSLSEESTAGKSDDDMKDFGYKAGADSRYYINSANLNLLNTEEKEKYAAQLYTHYITFGHKLYYKFLYSLRDSDKPVLQGGNEVLNYKREYITGYISVIGVGYDPVKGIYLELGDNDKNGKMDKNLPRWVGFKTLLTNGMYALSKPSDVTTSEGGGTTTIYDGENKSAKKSIDDNSALLGAAYRPNETAEVDKVNPDMKHVAKGLALENTFNYFGRWVGGGFTNPNRKKVCRAQNFELSYFKLPVYHSKKGGGCRVKRLLSYDPGMNGETGDAMVYGTEYIYKLQGSNLSSGVATFEPQSIREENALVTLVERKKQKKIDKLFNGKDSKIFEGPIGESLYPGASIGYSRVITKNIHSGKTTTGYVVSEYHTCKEFKLEYENTAIDKDHDTYKKLNFSLPLGMVNIEVHKAWVTQGYVFLLNDMHGKPKRSATYAGDYNEQEKYFPQPTAETVYHYTRPGEAIKGLGYDPVNQTFEISNLKLGQEEDLTMYRSRVEDITNNFSLELDLNITLPIAISVGGAISYSYSRNELSQHVTNKVIHQMSFLKSTTSTVDGVIQTTENIAFNKYTGDPVLTRTYDGFTSENEKSYLVKEGLNGKEAYENKGHYYALSIPASWIYSELGQKYANGVNKNELTGSVGSIVTYGKNELYDAITTGNTVYANANGFSSVISASQIILKKNMFDPTTNSLYSILSDEYGISGDNLFILNQLNSNYYPYRNYIYRDQTINERTDITPGYINRSGTLKSTVSFFDWFTSDYLNEIGKWTSLSKVLAYSPNGVPLEEEDIMGVHGVAKFGDNKTLPLLTAENARYNQVYFKDFESITSDVNQKYAHTGRKSLDLRTTQGEAIITSYDFTDLGTRGVGMKLWLKSSLNEDLSNVNYGKKNQNPQLKALVGGHSYSFKRVAQTGEWSLYELEMTNLYGMTGLHDIVLSYNFLNDELVLVDDVRIQPLDASMNCVVYTKDNKIQARFDNQHFAVFYEYNKEGLLLRKSIETEKGRKTVEEQQKNTPLINKN